MVKRKLFKRALSRRALPFILSVAMVFQSMPATAMAEEPQVQEASAESAEADSAASSAGSGSHEDDFSKDSSGSSESRASEENAGASNEDVSNGENSNENASNGENSNENASNGENSNEENSNEENSNENISDEAASNESTSNESASTEGVSSENASDESTLDESTSDEGAASESVSTESVSEEAKQPAAETPEETESESEGIKLNEEAAKVSILVDTEKLHSALKNEELHYDEEDGTIFALYDAKTSNPFAAIQNGYCETDDESGEKIKDYFITVEQGSASNEALRDRLVYTWKNADGTALADGAVVPKNKGSYQLEIKLDKIDNVCEETVETLKFRIDARSVLVNYDEIDVILPGTTAEEAAKAIKEGYQLDLTDIDGDKTGEHLIKELDVVSCDVSIVRQRKEDGTQDNTKLNPADLIKSTEEYLIQMEITLTDQNYTLANTSSRLEVAVGVRTEIKAASVQPDGTSFGWQYGDQPDLAALIKVINPYVVESDTTTESEEETKVADAKLQYQWLDADEKELEETPGDGTKLPDKVKDAGTYYLRISYAGEPGRYLKSDSADITVVVSAVNVCIGGIEIDTAEYVDGAAVSKVLQTITGYSVYKSGDADKKNIMGDDKYFWGVSNNGDADENTQSYEPVFAVRRGTHVKDKDGKDSVKWDTNYLDSYDKLVKTEKVGDEDITYEYRIEFSGKKAVYGEYDAPIDINRSQSNYLVDVTEDTLAANAFTIKLAVEGPAIDVTEMLIGDAASETDKGSLKNPMTKIYDGAPYFQTKNDYKKAKVTGRTDVASTELSYQWQKIVAYHEIENEEEGKESDFEIEIDESGYKYTFNDVEYESAPLEAGRYRLVVRYTDKKSGAVSTAYVYYTIKKEDLLIQPESRVPAYYGETIADYLDYVRVALMLRPTDADGKEMISYTVTDFSKEGNGAPADADWLAYILGYLESEYGGNLSQKDSIGALIWKVERKITEGDKAGTWYELQDDDTFVEGVEYRLTVHADWQDIGNYVTDSYDEGIYVGDLKNYNNLYALDFKDEKVFDKQTNAYKTQARYADLQSTAITPVKSEGIEVEFEVDWDKITQTTKLYDGEMFTEALDAVKGAVKAYNKKTGAEINSEDITFGFEWTRESVEGTETHYVSEKNIVHAGTYYLNLIVPKSEIYAGEDVTFDKKNDKAFTITPRELTVTPVLKDEIKAGTEILSSDGAWGNAQNVRNIIDQLQVSEEMLLGDDKTCFFDKVRYYGDSEISYPWCMYDDTDKDNIQVPRLEVTDKTTGKPMTGYLRGDRAYNAKFSFGGKLGDYVLTQDQQVKHVFYGSDYTLKFDTISFTTVRDQSSVSATTIGNPESGEYDSLKILDSVIREKDSFTHTITPREGIPYNKYYRDEKSVDSNHFSLEIQAPLEYTDVQGAENSVIYRNSIEKAGGFNVGLSVIDEDSPRYFIVRADFDAAQIAETGGTSFEITWEEGFTETFKLEVPKNLLMEDLSKAVLPKSLAFNGAVTKMTVGEGQQLDLKITKVQMADTICVAYESSDEKVLTVSDSGSVTAIHTGKATVTAYAAYKDSTDNKIKPFIDAKGNYAKAAKLNITVSKLSEVKNIKLEAHDTYAYIDYKDVTDGYRREVYVLKGANIAAGEFESKIEAVKNGDYSAFDAHLFITAAERNESNNTGKKFWAKITGLQPNTQYTVYVRNVSALRKFPNGEQIDPSEFATASKPAKLTTTKSQQKALNGYFKTKEGERDPFVNGLTTVRNDEKSAVKAVYQYNNDYEEYEHYYTVDISAKSVKLDVEAKYFQKYQEGIDYADQNDYIWYPLSLTKELQKDYINPKLTYYVTTDYYVGYGPEDWKQKGYVHAGDYYFKPVATQAAIDKNGKISLKGSGTVFVIAYDAEQDITCDPVKLRITTEVDGLAGKAIKMKVGSRIYLSDYLTYKQKNIKLSQYNDDDKDLVVTLEDPDGAFELKPSVYDGEVYDGALRISDYQIIAKRPTTRPLELKVSDKTVTKNGGSEITIKLSASALDPVKSLKAYDVYDTQGSIRFDYAGRMDNSNLQFRIEVKDQSGKILKNQLVDSSNEWREFSYRNEAFYKALYNHDYKVYNEYWEDWEYSNGFREYNAKKNIYTYYYDLINLEGLKLTRLSNYTVSVTAVYDGYDAKTATTKIKTTNIPASRINVAEYDDNGKDKNNDGGVKTVTVYKNKNNTNTMFLDTYPLLKSGNSYTLDFTGGDKNARNMKTDTLTWKSSNTKVATVKANSGTFTAALKAVKKGTTQITVTSKITKKVIARWTVFVTAVGEADGYFGDNIDQNIDADGDNGLNADKLGADLLTLNNSMSFTLANGEKKWVAFKAPSDGRYWVNIVSEEGSFIAYDSDSRPLGSLGSNFSDEEMEKGETVYFLLTVTNAKTKKQTVTIKATGTPYTTLTTAADGVKVRGGSTVVFTAPEENVYTFTAVDKNGKEASVWNGNRNTIVLEKNAKKRLTVFGQDEYTIKVTPAEQLTDNTKLELKKGETKYYKFTPDETNEYTLYTAEASEQIQSATIYTAYYENLNSVEDAQTKPSSDTDTNPKNVGFETRKLEKGNVRYLSFTAGNQDTTAVFKAEKAEKTGVPFTIGNAGGEKTVVYNVDKDGEYNFTATGTDVTITKVEVSGVSKIDNNTTASYQTSLKKGDYVKLTVSAKNADTSVTVNCTFVEPVQVQAGASAAVAVISELEKKVEFTASENGWYAFTFDKDTVKVSYTKGTVYAKSMYQSGTELYVKKGGTLTFTVSTTETTEQTVTVTAAKNSSVKLTNMTEPVTLTKGKTYRYYWTAAQEGLYEFDFTVTGADLTCSTDEAGENTAEYISGYYEKGKTFYVTVNVSDSADGSFKAVIVNQKDAAELKADTDNTVTVGAKASKWVSFTSKQAVKARYQYSKADGDGFNFYENTGLDDSGTANISFTEDKILRPGEKVYYKIENQNAEEKTVKLRIDTIKPTEVSTAAGTGVLSGTANIKAGTNGWYHFHAANAGRYNIFVNSKADGETVGIANYQVYQSLTEGASNTNSVQFIKAGKDIYIKVPNEGAQDTDITVTVTDMAAAGTTLKLGEAKELQLKQGVTQYLVYNVTETARYTLTSITSDNKEYPLDVIYYVDKEKGVEETTPVSAVYWTAGSSIVFEVLPTTDATVKVTLAKENIIELTDEAAQQTISAGQTLYFQSKTGAKDVRYFIETSEMAEGLTLNYVSVTGGISWNNGYTDFVAAPKQEEVIFGLTAVSTFEGTKTFKMKRGIVTPAAVKAGTPAESAELAAYHKTYYTFTPEKAGRYSIKAGGASVSECRNGITGRFSEIHVPDDFIVTDAMVGKEVIYSLYHADTAAKKLNFSITETTAEELVSDTPYTVDITKVELNESVWLHFKAPADGRYTVAISNANIASAMYCYEALDQNQYTTVRYYGTEYCMKAGEEYYFPVSYSEKPEENFTISVSAITDSSAEAVSVSETAKEFDMKAGEVKWLKFTPEQTANYKLNITNASIVKYEEIDSHPDTAASWWNGNTMAFAAGKTVYFKLTANTSLQEGSKPSVKITSEEMQTLTEGDNTISQIAENENNKYAYFAPSEKAVYGFELTDSTACRVEISTDGSFKSYEHLSNTRSYVLDKTQPAYIRIVATGSDKESVSAAIRITKTAAIGEISMGGAVDVTLTRDSNMAFYHFTAPEDGIYVFDTNQDKAYIYAVNSIWSELLNPDTYNDWGTTRSSAVKMKKGELKYIRIAEYKNNLDSVGNTYTLTCKKAAETSFIGAKTIKIDLKKEEPVYVRWTAGEKGNYEFGFRTDDNTSVEYKYYYDNENTGYPTDNGQSMEKSWKQYESDAANSRELILESNEKPTQVEVSAQIVPRSLATGGTEKVVLDYNKRYEEFNFSAEAEKMYIFQTRGAENSRMNITVTDTSSNTAVTPDRTYYQDNDCYRVYTFENSGEYKLRVSPVNGNSYGDTFEISAYYYQQWIGFKLYNREDDFSTSWDVEKNGEIWLQFNVEESGRYGFGADDRTVVNLYRFDNGNLELLGVKESGSSSKIWSALGVGDVIYAQTWYGYSHNDSSYSVNVTCNLSQQGAQNWTFYGSQTESTPISVNQGYERAVPLNIDNLSSTAKYAFRIESSYDSENIETAMYQTSKDENGIETRELIAEGYNFTCEINPNNSYELRISNYGNSYWYGSIYAEKAYPYEEYELTLDNNAQKVTVKDGSEARFYFTVPEDGTYMLYGTSDSYCDNYAELWVNDEKRTSTGYGGQNGQFSISAQLSAGDKVELRTYMQNHAIADGTYTVHIENVPEDYQSMDQMYMSSTSLSANISSLSAGETKKYRFIAPTLSAEDGDTAEHYIFYSEILASTDETAMNLTANVQLASEVSTNEGGETDGDGDNENGGTDGDTDAGENGGTTGNNDSSTNG